MEFLGSLLVISVVFVIIGSTRAAWYDGKSIERACKKLKDKV